MKTVALILGLLLTVADTQAATPPPSGAGHKPVAPVRPNAMARPGRVAGQIVTPFVLGPYGYDGAGNIKTIGAEAYRYDAFGRLKTSTQPGSDQEFNYDRFGNMKSYTADDSLITISVDAGTNRLTPSPTANITGDHDANGNLIEQNGGASTFEYDELGMMKSSTAQISATESRETVYLYTADDERVAAVTIGGTAETTSEWTIRDVSNRVLRRYTKTAVGGEKWSWKEDYIYGGGQMLAAEVPTAARTLHFFSDHLGTPRLITGNGGAKVAEHRYRPFGTEITSVSQDGEQMKFTGHERDFANGSASDPLDYMHARYYSPGMGRFLSVDPGIDVKKALVEPQLWNRYAYVTNNPLRYRDPDGRFRDGYFEKPMTAENLAMDENTPAVVKGAFYAEGALLAAAGAEAAGLFAAAKEGATVAGTWALGNLDKIQAWGRGVLDFFSPPGSSVTNAITGDFERVLQTKGGAVTVMANASTEGSVLTLKDIAVYGKDTTLKAGSAGAGAFKTAIRELAAEAKANGYTRIVLQGLRYSGATKGTGKEERDIIINLVK